MSVRTRIAPSPTGDPHVGTAYVALFNMAFAHSQGGQFLLRIEDTDQARSTPESEKTILDALKWLGLEWNEGPDNGGPKGPYRQSERSDIYQKYAQELIDDGHAFRCFCSPEELDEMRASQIANKEPLGYDGRHMDLSDEDVESRIANGDPYVVRMKVPREGTCTFSDMLRGEVSIDWAQIDYQVLLKADGMPTYHLANVVDDHLMEISHVIRGEEWLPSLALHKLLYDAFDWEPPKFAHLPLILKPTGKGKLSKRDGDKLGFPVFPLEWINNGGYSAGFKESGYLPEAIINFLSFLGWNPGTEEEIFDMENLINCFSLSKINKAGARFDTEKIKWFNQHYISNEKNSVLANFLVSNHSELKSINKERIAQVVGLIKDRANLLTDLWPLSCYFFVAPLKYDEKGIKKAWKAESGKIMASFSKILIDFDDSSPESLKKDFEGWIKTKKLSFGSVVMPLRLAIVGELKGADIFDIIHSIGKNETVSRIKRLKDQV